MYLKSKPNVVSFKSALKAKSDILDKITFDGLQGINKDITYVNAIFIFIYFNATVNWLLIILLVL